MQVWLAEKNDLSRTILGIFSTPQKAMQPCQDDANAYFGAERTPKLKWLGDDRYRSASYIHPCGSSYLFQVTRFTINETEEP